MIVENDSNPTVVDKPHGGVGRSTYYDFFSGKKDLPVFLHNSTLSAGSTMGFHRHEHEEEIYYIIWGKGLMRVDDEEIEVGPGDAILTKKGGSHGLKNIGKTELRMIVVGGRV